MFSSKNDVQQHRKLVLLVDDAIEAALLMKAYFLRKNYLVSIVHSVEAALFLMGSPAPAVIVISPDLCNDKGLLVEQFCNAFPGVELILCGQEEIYRNGDVSLF